MATVPVILQFVHPTDEEVPYAGRVSYAVEADIYPVVVITLVTTESAVTDPETPLSVVFSRTVPEMSVAT